MEMPFGKKISRRCAKINDNTFRCEAPMKTKDGEVILGTVDVLVKGDGSAEVIAEDCESEKICKNLKAYMASQIKIKRSSGEQ